MLVRSGRLRPWCTETKYGLGLPLKDRPEESEVLFTRVNYAGRPIYQVGISFFKVALLISYLRLFEGTNERIYRRVVWTAIILISLSHLGCALALIFACKPVRGPVYSDLINANAGMVLGPKVVESAYGGRMPQAGAFVYGVRGRHYCV